MKQKIKAHAKCLSKKVVNQRKMVLLGVGSVLLVATLTYALLRTTLPLKLVYTSHDVKVDQPVRLQLNQFIQTIDTTKISISPRVAGTWKFTQPSFTRNGVLSFTPSSYLKEHTTYTVTLPSAVRAFGSKFVLPAIAFTTEKAPSLTSNGSVAWKDGQTIAADARFVVGLSSPNHRLRELELRTTPAVETKLNVKDDKTYTWQPTGLLPQGSDVAVEVYDTRNQESLLKKTVRIADEPHLTSPLDQTNIDEHDTIKLAFAQTIEPTSAHITFDVPGKGAWENETTYAFTPQSVAPNKTYHYTVAKSLRSKDGGILKQDIAGSFTTIGPVAVIGMSPHGNGLAQGSQTLSFTFNRPVDHASAEQRLSISSGQITNKSWAGNTLKVTVVNIGFQQTFSATIAAGVTNATFGAPSTRAFGLSFTTEVRSVRWNVPAFRQQHSGTCTAASLRMALAYRGIGSDEMGLVNAMGYNPRPIDKSTDPAIWDDPQVMFVGSVDGSIAAGTGAGPDAPPVAKAARAYGRSAESVTGIGSGWIAQQLYNGNPVIMFGSFRSTGTTTWKTPNGATRVMNLTGHATVVIGVKGEPSNPLGFWVNDPLGGTSYWSTAAVNANIARDPDRQAVVVY